MSKVNTKVTIGVDLGDKRHRVCVLSNEGEVLEESWIVNTKTGVLRYFSKYQPLEVEKIALETGTHSRWISNLLQERAFRALVANSRKLRMIWNNDRKSDVADAEMLARVARFDEELLSPIHHRGQSAQLALTWLKSRDILVKVRTALINHVRGTVKTHGYRLPKCSAECFHKRSREHLPEELKGAVEPVLSQIEYLTKRIRWYERKIDELIQDSYPEAEHLMQIQGVGSIVGLAYVLTIEDPWRMKDKRSVGAFLGLIPKRDQSGERDHQLRISKRGDKFLRRLLVSSAQYIIGPLGPDCELRRYGLRIYERGGRTRNAKRRAAVAVARKLSVLMLALWRSQEPYDPWYHHHKTKAYLKSA